MASELCKSRNPVRTHKVINRVTRHMTNRTISIATTPLDYNILQEFIDLLAVADSTPGPIDVVVSSNGGDTMVAMAMYDAIKGATNKVRTIGLGSVGSAAVLVFAAGDERLLGPNASLFFHGTSVYAEGSFKNVSTINREMERVHNRYCSLITEQSGMSPGVVESFCKEEMYMDPATAVKHGIATGIYKKPVAHKAKKK